MKRVFKILIPVGFFIIGLLISFFLQKGKKEDLTASSAVVMEDSGETEEDGWGSSVVWQETELNEEQVSDNLGGGGGVSGKFTLVETSKITADKTRVETGENVAFSAVIKNEGQKTKYLTHLCFNHSKGITFGCLNGPQGPSIDPGREFPIGGETVFTSPGTYYVWLTWSQDETNFYKPINAGSAVVLVE